MGVVLSGSTLGFLICRVGSWRTAVQFVRTTHVINPRVISLDSPASIFCLRKLNQHLFFKALYALKKTISSKEISLVNPVCIDQAGLLWLKYEGVLLDVTSSNPYLLPGTFLGNFMTHLALYTSLQHHSTRPFSFLLLYDIYFLNQ